MNLKMMIRPKKWRFYCTISLYCVIFMVFVQLFSLYTLTGGDFSTKEYTYNEITEEPPIEFLQRAELMYRMKYLMLIGVAIMLFWEWLLYIENPEQHFITPIIKKLKRDKLW